MDTQEALERYLGTPRFATYLGMAGGDVARAAALYRWNQQLSGALHTQIAYVEIAVRNAIDHELADWNSQQPEMAGVPDAQDWTMHAAGALYSVLGDSLRRARQAADKEVSRRDVLHPRHGQPATHGDVIAQLMFGSWCKVLDDPNAQNGTPHQEALWSQALHRAFPNRRGANTRVAVANQLDRVRLLRNRVAHHDSLLNVDVSKRLNDMLAVLGAIDRKYPSWAMEGSLVRLYVRQDPRRRPPAATAPALTTGSDN